LFLDAALLVGVTENSQGFQPLAPEPEIISTEQTHFSDLRLSAFICGCLLFSLLSSVFCLYRVFICVYRAANSSSSSVGAVGAGARHSLRFAR
jgi:hypothetical protein